MTERHLLRVQAASGSLFAIFLIVHLLNAGAAAVGPNAYDGVQKVARGVYPQPVVEIVLVAMPLLVHMAAALLRLRRRGFRRPHESRRALLHRYSGYYLLLVITGHVLATRGPSLLLDFHPGAAGLAFSLWWQPWMFYPYYALMIIAGAYHTAHGLTIAVSTFHRPLPNAVRRGFGFWAPVFALAAFALLGVFGLGGWLYDVPTPTDNDYARMWESFGVDLKR